jgi:transcription elongation factor Elf1
MIDFTCPRCNKPVSEYPALSRRDNATDICSACGTEEAMFDFAHTQAGIGLSLGLDVYTREKLFAQKIKK